MKKKKKNTCLCYPKENKGLRERESELLKKVEEADVSNVFELFF
jgi:hypothetical protein